MSQSNLGNGRDTNGRFAEGNPGGPGRPRRAVEADYLAALGDAVPIDRWRKIVERAVTDAEQGDAKAREWLSRYVTGGMPAGLTSLAAYEAAGGIDHEIEKRANEIKRRAEQIDFFDLGGWMKK
jgi:hypothetical protein